MRNPILAFFGLTTLAHAANRYLEGMTVQRERDIQQREEYKLADMKMMIGKPVIGISNEWENPVIGTVIGIEFITQAQQPIPIVRCAITGKEFITFSKVMPFTMQRFEALMKLNPYERWCLVDNQNPHAHRSSSMPKLPTLFTLEDYIEVLKRKDFIGLKEEVSV